MDMQSWSGLTRLQEVFDRLRPELRVFRNEAGRELFDMPNAPRPDPRRSGAASVPPQYDNVLLGHADRTRLVMTTTEELMAAAGTRTVTTFLFDGVVAGMDDPARGRCGHAGRRTGDP